MKSRRDNKAAVPEARDSWQTHEQFPQREFLNYLKAISSREAIAVDHERHTHGTICRMQTFSNHPTSGEKH
ncbi:MAG: hypothetical protein ABGZ53_28810 [Fuerstiella sp.]